MKNGQMVKGIRFKADRVVGSALQAAKVHAMRGVDEIMILDVSATQEGREPNYAMIKQLTETTTVPVTVGGGISEIEHVQQLFDAGADKVCIGTHKHLIKAISARYGNQAVVASVDIAVDDDYINQALDAAETAEWLGAGEILLQAIDRDGTMKGYDQELIDGVANYIGIPVIASGGCSGYDDMVRAVLAGADAVAAGALYQFTNSTPRGAAQYMHEQRIEVRVKE